MTLLDPSADRLPAAIKPSNDMIVLPFHHAYRNNFGMIPVRTQDDFMLVSPSHYDPERYPPGSDAHHFSPAASTVAGFSFGGGDQRD
ncbi:hypothetical protein [Mesorhizobium japonicum]|uniref:hypothetical protein n=1 Tax=Mesorhizobium japonicum TaxID=2066070 RepID=UPI000321F882|nr:hypothetical protein [Mesorhizobium japonicum]